VPRSCDLEVSVERSTKIEALVPGKLGGIEVGLEHRAEFKSSGTGRVRRRGSADIRRQFH
jgi:hypothetical protein